MKRREFIILTSVGATGATVLSACGHPENKLIPALIPDNEYVPGLDYWKSTACPMCDAGCGIVVRTREHKANKIEGNPLHPVNRGALCARGQAGLQTLYNPDRIKGPMKRAGQRGSGQFEAISWDEAIKTLADKMREAKAQGHASSSAFITSNARSVTAHVGAKLMEAYGGSGRGILTWPLFNEVSAETSYSNSYGSAPFFDIANATYLLSFGARFLETWHSPVMHSLAYGEFRNAKGKPRGKFVQVEPRMSLTAANSDEWLPARMGAEGLVALAMAQVIAREGLARTAPAPEFVKALESVAPEQVAERVDIAAEKMVRIAREFASAERPLSIGSSDPASMQSINYLNILAGNIDKRGGVILPQRDLTGLPFEKLRPKDRFGEMAEIDFSKFLDTLGPGILLIHQINPLFTRPSVREKFGNISFIASFSSFMDETTEMADLILPDHTYLESWDISSSHPTSGGLTVTLTQPVISPQHDTRQTADVLLAVGRELGGEAGAALPFKSAEEIIKQEAAVLANRRGSINAESSEDFWTSFSERGVWIGEAAAKSQTASLPDLPPLAAINNIKSQETTGQYPLLLMVYEHPTLGDGSFANLPWLQELPDPMTSVIWGSWVEINPKTAASLAIADGDLVEVTTPHGSLRVPAAIYPAIRPDVIAMPFGQGHTAYGRYAKARGANAAQLIPLAGNGPRAETTAIAKISKVAGEASLIRFGTDLLEKIETDRSR